MVNKHLGDVTAGKKRRDEGSWQPGWEGQKRVFVLLVTILNKHVIKMHQLAANRQVKLYSDHRLHSTPLRHVEQSRLVLVITWLIKPTKSSHNDQIQLLPCFTQIMNHSFELICYGNLVIFPLSWDGKWAIIIIILCFSVCERARDRGRQRERKS